MKKAVGLALGIAVMSSALPTAAQDRITAPGPISRAIAREAVRLGTAQQVAQPLDPDWARVRRLAAGTEVTLTVRESQPGARHVVLANEHDLTVLNLTNPAIPSAARSVLFDVALHHPEYFEMAQQGDGLALDKNVRLAPEGLFVAGRKVADLGTVVERIQRSDVREIRTAGKTRGSVAGGIGGAAGGLLLGGRLALGLAFKDCGGGCGDEKALIGLAVVGLPIAGAILGYRLFAHKTADVIYRAP